MQHQGTKILETERLILRKMETGDVAAAYRNWTHDNQVTKYLRWPTHSDIKVTSEVIHGWVQSYQQDNFYQWAIVPKDGKNEPIGIIGVVEQDDCVGKVQIGYSIGSKWWHQGYTSEAFAAIIPFLFEQVKVNRIESQHDPNNANSGKVMEKCGLQYEGTLRQADYSNVGIVDAAIYALLAEDYYKSKTR